ncbi:hypothetical protein SAMD00023353_0902790 [Rosellinia necatrix]|uniref:Uncharacterized protein n=1 Tax=Rosellinia necatrix TaxID=77044 RepID=A0A1W2TLA3_ROSNE|nr:hypothetical protein SAMD00023353_0902790 [Rosellinia necatrix]
MRSLLVTFFVYASFTFALTGAASLQARSWQEGSLGAESVNEVVNQNQGQPETAFSRLLNAVSPRALNQLLKDGVFGSDRRAVEEVNVEDTKIVSRIIHLAIRQGSSSNDTTTSDPPTSAKSTTSETSSTTSTEEPTTSAEPMPTETTTSEDPTTSSEPPSTTTMTTTTTSKPTSISTPPAETSKSTETTKTTETKETPKPTPSSSTPTSDTGNADPPQTSVTPAPTVATPTSKTSIFTSTRPDGAVTTVTEVAIVTPGASEGDNNDSTPTSAVGNLQTGPAARIVGGQGLERLFGLFIGAMMLI